MRAGALAVGLIVVLSAAACAAPPAAPRATATSGGIAVTASLERDRFAPGETIQLAITVRNATAAPLVVEFASGQRVDYVIRAGAREVWRWSEDRAFTMALGSEVFAPGQARTFREPWTQVAGDGRAVEPGSYAFVGVLTALLPVGRVEAGPVPFSIVRR